MLPNGCILESLRLVGIIAYIVGLSFNVFDVAGGHQVATLLHELIFDLAQIAVHHATLA